MIEVTSWSFWQDAELIKDDNKGNRVFTKEEFICFCPNWTEPGDADSIIKQKRSSNGDI